MNIHISKSYQKQSNRSNCIDNFSHEGFSPKKIPNTQ